MGTFIGLFGLPKASLPGAFMGGFAANETPNALGLGRRELRSRAPSLRGVHFVTPGRAIVPFCGLAPKAKRTAQRAPMEKKAQNPYNPGSVHE